MTDRNPPSLPLVLRPHPPRVPLAGRRRLHRPGAGRTCSRATASSAARAGAADGRGEVGQPAGAEASRTSRPRPRASSSCSCTAARATSTRSTTSRSSTSSTARRSRSRPSAAAGNKNEGRVVGPKWKFKQYGQCGKCVSDLFPHLGELRRRHRLPPLDDRRLADPRLGHAADEHGPDPLRAARAWARGSTTAWAATTRTCPASSSCSTRPAGRSAAPRTGRAATCRPRYQGDDPPLGRRADPRPQAPRRA